MFNFEKKKTGIKSSAVHKHPASQKPLQLTVSPSTARLLGSLDINAFGHNQQNVPKLQKQALLSHAQTLVNLLRSFPAGMVTVTGHCDATGTTEYNQQLGLDRAEAVKIVLSNAGVDASRIITNSQGEGQLRVDTQQSEPRNRRVGIRFQPTPVASFNIPPLNLESEPAPDLTLPESFVDEIVQETIPPFMRPLQPQITPPEKRPDVDWSYSFPAGLVIIINPQAETRPEEDIGVAFRDHGIPLTSDELTALLEGREEGIEQLKKTISTMAPGMHKSDVEKLAKMAADGLMSRNLNEQLGREFPNLLTNQQRREEQLEHQLGHEKEEMGITPSVILKINF